MRWHYFYWCRECVGEYRVAVGWRKVGGRGEDGKKIIFVILYRARRLQSNIAFWLLVSLEAVQPTRPDERGGSGSAFLFLTCRSATPPAPQRASVDTRSVGRGTIRRMRNDPSNVERSAGREITILPYASAAVRKPTTIHRFDNTIIILPIVYYYNI